MRCRTHQAKELCDAVLRALRDVLVIAAVMEAGGPSSQDAFRDAMSLCCGQNGRLDNPWEAMFEHTFHRLFKDVPNKFPPTAKRRNRPPKAKSKSASLPQLQRQNRGGGSSQDPPPGSLDADDGEDEDHQQDDDDYLSFHYENQLLREPEAGASSRGDNVIYDLQLSNLLFGDSNTPPAHNSSEGEGSELEQQEGESNASLKIRIEMKREQRLLRKASLQVERDRKSVEEALERMNEATERMAAHRTRLASLLQEQEELQRKEHPDLRPAATREVFRALD